ncbi:MAG TPA: site-specific integrase [Solirubrobacterales bacterium]|nr:site-specific integrase [Solirubrobacterales bacterium]
MAKLVKTSTPGIYRRGSRYVVVWRHRGKQHKSFHRTYEEAREAKGRRQAGDRRPASRDRFEDFAPRWLEGYRGRTSRGLSKRTRAIYRRDMERWVIPHFGGCRLDEVEPPDVRDFIAELDEAGLRPNSIRAILAPMKAMYATAFEDGAVRSNPTVNVRIGAKAGADESEREVRAMTRAELARLLGHVPEDWQLLMELLTHSGLRISEAIGLTWANVTFGATPRLQVRRQDCRGELGPLKSATSRRDIPLSPGMARRLWAVRGSHGKADRVFTSPQGFPLAYGNLRRRVLVPATEAAGLEWVTFHTFRHTCASLLFEADRDVKQVSEWLGHANAGFTLKVYVHLMDDGVGDAAFMDEAVKVGNDRSPATPLQTENDELAELAKTA